MAKDKTSSAASSAAPKIETASPVESPHPVLDQPKLDEGYDSPSLLWSAFLSYALDKIVYHTRRIFAPSSTPLESSIIGSSCFFLIYLLPRIISYFSLRSRRKVLRGMAARKKKMVEERNKLIVQQLGLSGKRPQKEHRLTRSSATELLRLMRQGKVTCVEVVTAFCARAAQVQDVLNCGTEYCFVEAIETARMVDKWRERNKDKKEEEPPLLGLPVSIKDLFHQEGYDTTCGCSCYLFDPADKDGETIQILTEQGAIPFIRTNVPQAMMIPETYNLIYGKSRNPYNLERTVGGSSGGEGGLVASFGSCLGVGTDIGGSIRIPAHNNGICGFKPSAERFTQKGSRAARYDGKNGQVVIRSTSGPLARSVDDLVLYMKAVCGNNLMNHVDPYRPPLEFNDKMYTDTRSTCGSPTPLKIGYFSSCEYFPTSRPCQRAVDMAVEALRNRGHICVNISKAMPSLALGFEIYVKTLVCDGRVRSIKEGLYGEDFVDSYKYIYTLSLIPNWLRSTISFVLENFAGEPRKAKLNKVMGELSVYHSWQNIADLKRYQQHWVDTLKAFELDGIVCPGGLCQLYAMGNLRTYSQVFLILHCSTCWIGLQE